MGVFRIDFIHAGFLYGLPAERNRLSTPNTIEARLGKGTGLRYLVVYK